jgi:hypothetical protein
MKPTSLHEVRARFCRPLPTHIADELRRYDAYLHDARGLAATTRSNQLRIVGLFLRQNFGRRAVDPRKLRPDDIRRFLSSQLGGGAGANGSADGLSSRFNEWVARHGQVAKHRQAVRELRSKLVFGEAGI